MAHFCRQFSYKELIDGLADMPSVLEAPKIEITAKQKFKNKAKQTNKTKGQLPSVQRAMLTDWSGSCSTVSNINASRDSSVTSVGLRLGLTAALAVRRDV